MKKILIILVLSLFLLAGCELNEVKEKLSNLKNETKTNLESISNFRCEKELDEELKIQNAKYPSGSSVKIIEEKSFTNKEELLRYIDKWNPEYENEVISYIEEITKIEEKEIIHDIQNDIDKKEMRFIFDYPKEDINSARFVVTGIPTGEDKDITICDETIQDHKGTITCDVSDYASYGGRAYIDRKDIEPKIWEGRIDIAVLKTEGNLLGYEQKVAFITFAICDDEGKLRT